MRSLPPLPTLAVAGALAVAGLTAATTTATSAADAGRPIVALTGTGSALVRSTTAAPGTTTTVPVTGVTTGETLVGVTFRPTTGALYGVGVNSTLDTATLYTLASATGVATKVGAGQFSWSSDGSGFDKVDLPDTVTSGYGVDFNPSVDKIRFVASNGFNARIDPTGVAISGTGGGGGTATNPTPDNRSASMATASYTNSAPAPAPATATTEYALLPEDNTLAVINLPNDGTATLQKEVLLNGTTGLDFTALAGLDIPSDVAVTASNAAVTSGTAYAVLTVGGVTGTYSLNLASGAATLLSTSAVPLRALAVGEVLPVTTTPAPAATPATIATTGKTKVKGSKVTLGRTVTCPAGGAPCPVTVTVRTRGAKSKPVTKTVTTTVAPGTSLALVAKLNKRGKKLLKAGKVKVTVAVTTTTAVGAKPATTTTKTVLKKKKSRRP